MQKPKRHHYLPQCYLKEFSQDGYLWVYDREQDEYRRQSLEKTCVEKHRYSIVTDEGVKDTVIETDLLAMIDNWYVPLIRKIDCCLPH